MDTRRTESRREQSGPWSIRLVWRRAKSAIHKQLMRRGEPLRLGLLGVFAEALEGKVELGRYFASTDENR